MCFGLEKHSTTPNEMANITSLPEPGIELGGPLNLQATYFQQIHLYTVETVICDFQWDFQEKVTYDRGSFKTV